MVERDAMGQAARRLHPSFAIVANDGAPHAKTERPEAIPHPLSLNGTLIAVIEMSQSSWLVAGIVPGVERQPLKKLDPDKDALLKLLHRWRHEAAKAGQHQAHCGCP